MKKILFMLILLIPFIVYAECDSKVIISKLELDSKKGYTEEIEPSTYECNNIKLNIKMYNKDDSIIYNLTIKNNSDYNIELSNKFTSDSESEYIVYKIEDNDLNIEKGKEKTFKLSATYTKLASPTLLVNGPFEDNHTMNLSITTIDENPNTSSTSIFIITVVLGISIITIILLITNKKHAPKYMSLLLIPVLVIPGIVYALTKFELKLEAKVVIAEPITPMCKPATTLHTAICDRSDDLGCDSEGHVGNGNTITYGTIPNGAPKSGDAYDCDVNNDGIYDSETERFYYITKDGDNSSLIYYTNMNDQETYAYATQSDAQTIGTCTDSLGCNWYGPQTGYQYLPSTTEWNNPGLIAPGTRQIVAENGATSTNGGTIEAFTYTDKAARFLTIQDINSACGITVGSSEVGELDGCIWLMENIGYYERESGTRCYGYWLETPRSDLSNSAFRVIGSARGVYGYYASYYSFYGVRPVITVKTLYIQTN